MFITRVLLIALLFFTVPAPSAEAFIILDASVLQVYEDNVNPALSGARRPGMDGETVRSTPLGARLAPDALQQAAASGTNTADYYTVLSVSGGPAAVVGVETELSVKAEITAYRFHRFTELNATAAGLRADLFKQFSDMHSAQLELACRRTEYQADVLNAETFAGSFELRQQVRTRLWLNEKFGYEENRGDDNSFTYSGRSIGLRTEYHARRKTAAAAGYGFTLREFTNGRRIYLHSVAANGKLEAAKDFFILAGVEHQRYKALPARVRTRNNIASLGVAFSY